METKKNKIIGFCIENDFLRPERRLTEALGELGTPALSDGLNKFNTMDYGIKPIFEGCKIAGPAVTLRLRPGDNLMLHKCLGMVKPGDVLVVDTCGCSTNSILGELIATAAFMTGLAGIVIDGGIRDILELRNKKFKIFTRFVTPSVGDKDGPGEINIPISCGGVPVHPGDIIVGDDNGVVVIPPAHAEQIIAGAKKKLEYEEKRMKDILNGIIVKPEIDEQLRRRGVIE